MKDVTLDFIFQIYIPVFQGQFTELCAVLVACNIACGNVASTPPFLFLSFWQLPGIPPLLPRYSSDKALIPFNDYNFQLLSLTWPVVGSGSEDRFRLLHNFCGGLTCRLHHHLVLQVPTCLGG